MSAWTRHPAGPAGDCAEDQVSDAVDVRWTRQLPSGHTAMVTQTWYIVKRDGVRDLESQVEFLVCIDARDPGGTEVWSDAQYLDAYGYAYPTELDVVDEVRNAVDTTDAEWNENVPSEWRVA